MRRGSLLGMCILVGCFSDPNSVGLDDAGTPGGSTSATGLADGPTGSGADAMMTTGNTTPGMGASGGRDGTTEITAATSLDAADSTDATDSSGLEPICGDDRVNGDEVCDDGVNDGAYGGCLPDCTARAPHCGDRIVNGAEVCDDGVNDGRYNGCNPNCTLGPYCGDGTVDGAQEQCDDGEENADGAGCNVDCVVSGSQIASFTDSIVGGFCEPPSLTGPTLREDGAALVTLTGCVGDPRSILVLDHDLMEEANYEGVGFPGSPIYQSTRLGDRWFFVSSGCDALLTDDGMTLTEVCQAGRIYGIDSHEAIDDNEYFALRGDQLAAYGPTSPDLNDAPVWEVAPPDGATFDYAFNAAALGNNGSVIAGGYRRTIASNSFLGYLTRRNNSNGSQAGSRTIAAVSAIDDVVGGPDGTALAISSFPEYVVRKLASNLNDAWTRNVSANTDIHGAIDGTGNVVLFYRDPNVMHYRLAKISADGGTDLWTVEFNGLTTTTNNGLSIDPNTDEIWLAYQSFDGNFSLNIEKYAP